MKRERFENDKTNSVNSGCQNSDKLGLDSSGDIEENGEQNPIEKLKSFGKQVEIETDGCQNSDKPPAKNNPVFEEFNDTKEQKPIEKPERAQEALKLKKVLEILQSKCTLPKKQKNTKSSPKIETFIGYTLSMKK